MNFVPTNNPGVEPFTIVSEKLSYTNENDDGSMFGNDDISLANEDDESCGVPRTIAPSHPRQHHDFEVSQEELSVDLSLEADEVSLSVLDEIHGKATTAAYGRAPSPQDIPRTPVKSHHHNESISASSTANHCPSAVKVSSSKQDTSKPKMSTAWRIMRFAALGSLVISAYAFYILQRSTLDEAQETERLPANAEESNTYMEASPANQSNVDLPQDALVPADSEENGCNALSIFGATILFALAYMEHRRSLEVLTREKEDCNPDVTFDETCEAKVLHQKAKTTSVEFEKTRAFLIHCKTNLQRNGRKSKHSSPVSKRFNKRYDVSKYESLSMKDLRSIALFLKQMTTWSDKQQWISAIAEAYHNRLTCFDKSEIEQLLLIHDLAPLPGQTTKVKMIKTLIEAAF